MRSRTIRTGLMAVLDLYIHNYVHIPQRSDYMTNRAKKEDNITTYSCNTRSVITICRKK